jgi:hypothetical protein
LSVGTLVLKRYSATRQKKHGSELPHSIYKRRPSRTIPEKEKETAREKDVPKMNAGIFVKTVSHFFASGVQTPLFDESGKHHRIR